MRAILAVLYVGPVTGLTIRPMTSDDVSAAERLSDAGFHELDLRMNRPSWPAPEPRSSRGSERWVERTLHFLRTDPGGCWVAEDETGLLGFATSFVRDTTWCLATYVVRPGLQGRGIGKPLLDAALQHGRACLHGMLSASSDPKALRRYHLAGFAMHPQMFMTGVVDRSAIPPIEKVREGSAADTDLMNSIDRQTRGAAHGPDHEFLQRNWRLVVSDTSTGSGYAYLGDRNTVLLLAASNRRTAARLLWTALADAPSDQPVNLVHITSANQWAIDVGMAARLELHQDGYLGLRGMKPPAPYVHDGAML
jgi:GNAT superfamily N-acetyltransferase